MAQTRRKGAFRYLLLAIIPQSMSKGLEAMGDRAMLEAGPGQGAGTPYYLPALLLTLVALGLCLFALKRIFERLTGKDGNAGDPQPDRPSIADTDDSFSDKDGFDPDAIMRRYIENRPAAAPSTTVQDRPRGFGKRGL